jgi:selenium metabolism protein YedF
MKIIDCRSMACPVPVLTVKRALAEAGEETVQVLVDPGAPRENVARFAANRGYEVVEAAIEGGFALTLSAAGVMPTPVPENKTRTGGVVMLVGSDRLGDGAEELGRLLMKNFIISLLDQDELPDRLLFLNTGVFLTTEGSEILETLEKLGNRGMEVLSCGACLDFFHRKEQLRAGGVTNMFTIAESLIKAGSVIRL